MVNEYSSRQPYSLASSVDVAGHVPGGRGAVYMTPPGRPAGQHGALLEVLEVPQLLDACARGGAVDEALDLRAFVSRAALLHPDLKARRALEPSGEQQPFGSHSVLPETLRCESACMPRLALLDCRGARGLAAHAAARPRHLTRRCRTRTPPAPRVRASRRRAPGAAPPALKPSIAHGKT
jgi:hypothetical protein